MRESEELRSPNWRSGDDMCRISPLKRLFWRLSAIEAGTLHIDHSVKGRRIGKIVGEDKQHLSIKQIDGGRVGPLRRRRTVMSSRIDMPQNLKEGHTYSSKLIEGDILLSHAFRQSFRLLTGYQVTRFRGDPRDIQEDQQSVLQFGDAADVV